jgi:hypothetical protein
MLKVSYTGLPSFYSEGPVLSSRVIPPIRKAPNHFTAVQRKHREPEPYIVLPFHVYIERMRHSQVFLNRISQLENYLEDNA